MKRLLLILLLVEAGDAYSSLNDLYDISYDYGETENMIAGRLDPVSVRRTPQLVTQPLELVVNAGSTARLPCLVDSLEGFVLLWKKNGSILSVGSQIVDTSSGRLSVEKNQEGNTLLISGLTKQDQAVYTCSVSAFKRTEVTHSLRVRVAPVLETDPSSSVSVREGQGATLHCSVLEGWPPPTLAWVRPGGEKVSGGILDLPVVTRTSSGLYLCEGDNGFSDLPVSRSVTVTVTYPPTVVVSRSGDSPVSMTVTCQVDSVPSSTFGWWRGEERVVDQDGVHLHVGVRLGSRVNYSLLLSPVDSPVWGEYSCRASNGLGEAEASTRISGRTEEATIRLEEVSGSWDSQQVDMEVESQAVVHGFLLLYGTGNTTSQTSVPASRSGNGRWRGQVTLQGLLPGTQYSIRVVAETSFGTTESGREHSFTTGSLQGHRGGHSSKASITSYHFFLLLSFYMLSVL